MTYRLLMGVTVLPFVVSGWLWSVWLSDLAIQSSDQNNGFVVISSINVD